MPRNQLSLNEFKVRILKLKNKLYYEHHDEYTKGLANKYLNEVLDILDEYRY